MASLLALEPTTGGAFAEGAGAGSTGSWGEGLPRDKGWGRSRRRSGLRQNPVCWRGKPGAALSPQWCLAQGSRLLGSDPHTVVQVRRGARLQGHLNLHVPELLREFCPLGCW